MRLDLLRYSKNIYHIVVDKKKNIKFIDENHKKITNAYITFTPSELIIKKVEINSSIKESLIPSIIKAKLSKEIKKDFTFSYFLEKKEDNINIFRVEVILKKEILNIISKLKTKNINLITTDYHSLFSISKQYFKDDFISIYLTKDNIIYVMGKEKLNFFRSAPVLDTPEEIANDINRTIIYFKQQSKNLGLNNILISGDNELINNIYSYINAPISQPLSTIENISDKKFNEYFLIFGTLFSNTNFLPEEIKTFKLFNKLFILLSVFILGIIGYFGYLTFEKYTLVLENETALYKKQAYFLKLKESTKFMNEKTLDYYLEFISLEKKAQKAYFLDKIATLKPIFEYMSPKSITVDKNIRIDFTKHFDSFKELIKQKNKIEEILKTMNVKYQIQPNYESKKISLIIVLKREQ